MARAYVGTTALDLDDLDLTGVATRSTTCASRPVCPGSADCRSRTEPPTSARYRRRCGPTRLTYPRVLSGTGTRTPKVRSPARSPATPTSAPGSTPPSVRWLAATRWAERSCSPCSRPSAGSTRRWCSRSAPWRAASTPRGRADVVAQRPRALGRTLGPHACPVVPPGSGDAPPPMTGFTPRRRGPAARRRRSGCAASAGDRQRVMCLSSGGG